MLSKEDWEGDYNDYNDFTAAEVLLLAIPMMFVAPTISFLYYFSV